ncbi:MAG: HAD family phosphatase [Acetobacteraceae bacterium]|nr:HAD family phosphatase [Acetobacteraceae bacterium]
MRLPFKPTAVVFDMDGLLFDTEALYQATAAMAAAEQGRDFPDALFLRLIGEPWPANRALLIREWGSAAEVDRLHDDWMRHFDALAGERLTLKPGVAELLDTLDTLGLPRAIATSSAHAEVVRNLAMHGLTGRFDAVVARGDYARAKPAPDPYLMAAERLGMAPGACLALEDSHVGVRAAAASGMATVMVPDILPPTDEICALCVAVAADLHAVRGAILAVRGDPVDAG